MRNLKRMAAFLTALILCLGLSVTAFAAEADTGFSDVDAGDWYAEAAVYCRDNGLMNGTTATTFSPNATMTRAQLCAVLYRMAGSPEMTGRDAFADTPDGALYEDAVLWAVRNRIMSGYTASTFPLPESSWPPSCGAMRAAPPRKPGQPTPTKPPSPPGR